MKCDLRNNVNLVVSLISWKRKRSAVPPVHVVGMGAILYATHAQNLALECSVPGAESVPLLDVLDVSAHKKDDWTVLDLKQNFFPQLFGKIKLIIELSNKLNNLFYI